MFACWVDEILHALGIHWSLVCDWHDRMIWGDYWDEVDQ